MALDREWMVCSDVAIYVPHYSIAGEETCSLAQYRPMIRSISAAAPVGGNMHAQKQALPAAVETEFGCQDGGNLFNPVCLLENSRKYRSLEGLRGCGIYR